MNKKITSIALATFLLALSSCNKKDLASTEKHGLHLEYMDTVVKPGDDFFRYVNGLWYDKTEIPADKSTWGSFDELAQNTDLDVLNILKEAAKSNKYGDLTDEGKAINVFKTYLDTITRNKLGIEPIRESSNLMVHFIVLMLYQTIYHFWIYHRRCINRQIFFRA